MSDVDKKLEELQSVKSWADPAEMFNALTSAIELIKSLKDELDSAWGMLDELKSSEVEAHAEALKRELDRKITETLGLVRSKVVLA